jgi:hypothetical protein
LFDIINLKLIEVLVMSYTPVSRSMPRAPPAQQQVNNQPSRLQMIVAYSMMMAPTIAKISVLMLSILAAGLLISTSVAAPPVAALAGAGVLVGIMAKSALLSLGFIALIIWIIPSENQNPFD